MAASHPNQPDPANPLAKLWQSGVIFTGLMFVNGLGNYVYQGIIGRALKASGEYSIANNTMGLVDLLGLPIAIATYAITHYIAHFSAANDEERLRGLLAGSRKVLFRVTIAGSLLAILLLKPLCDFFNFPNTTLMVMALVTVIVGLWSNFAVALCQGMSWFKRLALIGLLGVALKLIFGWLVIRHHPVAEASVAACAIALLANAVLLFWWRDIFRTGEITSPWDREVILYLLVAAAGVGGNYFFLKGDQLVAQRYFSPEQRDAFSAAGQLGRSMLFATGPLLTVLFTARSGHRAVSAVGAQMKLLALYVGALVVGAFMVLLLRNFLVGMIFGRQVPGAAEMLSRFAWCMCFIGIVQAAGTWSMASRWFKLTYLYGALGLLYWLLALQFGRSPDDLLLYMTYTAGASAIILVLGWIIALRHSPKN